MWRGSSVHCCGRWATANVDALCRINELMFTCVFSRRGINHHALALSLSFCLPSFPTHPPASKFRCWVASQLTPPTQRTVCGLVFLCVHFVSVSLVSLPKDAGGLAGLHFLFSPFPFLENESSLFVFEQLEGLLCFCGWMFESTRFFFDPCPSCMST